MTTGMSLGLSEPTLRRVREILRELVPGCRAFVFGSRARGSAHRHSDLDLLLVSPEPIPLPRLFRLEEAFEFSDIPVHVDVVDRARLRAEVATAFEADAVELVLDAPIGSDRAPLRSGR